MRKVHDIRMLIFADSNILVQYCLPRNITGLHIRTSRVLDHSSSTPRLSTGHLCPVEYEKSRHIVAEAVEAELLSCALLLTQDEQLNFYWPRGHIGFTGFECSQVVGNGQKLLI